MEEQNLQSKPQQTTVNDVAPKITQTEPASTINGQTSTTIRPPKTSFFTEGRLHFLGIGVILVGIFGAYYQLNKMRGVDIFNMKFKKDPASEFRRNMEEMRRKREEYDKLPREFRR